MQTLVNQNSSYSGNVPIPGAPTFPPGSPGDIVVVVDPSGGGSTRPPVDKPVDEPGYTPVPSGPPHPDYGLPVEENPYNPLFDPKLDPSFFGPSIPGLYWAYVGGMWRRLDESKDYSDPRTGTDPWVGGGPGTPGWGDAPFFPEYRQSSALYSREPQLNPFSGRGYFSRRRKRYGVRYF